MDKGIDGAVLSANLKPQLYKKNDPLLKYDQDYLSTYNGWRYDICLSKDHLVQMPGDNRLKYLGKRNDGLDVWWDPITEQPFYSAISRLTKVLLGNE